MTVNDKQHLRQTWLEQIGKSLTSSVAEKHFDGKLRSAIGAQGNKKGYGEC
jgi:hypothetical protein